MLSRKVKFGAEEQPEANDPAWWGRGVRPDHLGTLGGLSLYRCHDERREPGDYNILFSQKAYRDVVRHLNTDTTREHGGLLLGYATGTSGPAVPTVLVTHSLPAKHTAGTPTSLTFTNETWAEWDIVAEEVHRLGIDLKRVGWYHSHPNIEIFLSRYDLDVCTTFDRLKCPVALVVDPIRDQGAFFVRGTEGYQPRSPKGFWEIHAESEAGVVWRNLEPVVFEPGQESGAITSADVAQPVTAADLPPHSVDRTAIADRGAENFLQPARRWSITAVLTAVAIVMLAAIAGTLGMLAATTRGQQAQIGHLEDTLQELQKKIVHLDTNLNTPAVSPPARIPTNPQGAGTTVMPPPKEAAQAPAVDKKPDTKKKSPASQKGSAAKTTEDKKPAAEAEDPNKKSEDLKKAEDPNKKEGAVTPENAGDANPPGGKPPEKKDPTPTKKQDGAPREA